MPILRFRPHSLRLHLREMRMDTSEFGFWAMLVFWGTAIGGIALGISWARMRGRNPVSRAQLEKSLKRRLEAGEINQEEYDRKMAALPKGDARQ